MLNGKFYTGLPPKMIERGGGGSTPRNRLESHLFWPDDTKVDSAIESRVKRRTSLQLVPYEKPRLQHSHSMSESDFDTKQLFKKEFAKSSIQFFDNIQEEGDAIHSRRQPLLRAGKYSRRDITAKPTATKLELPENIVNSGYTSAKKKAAFTSKIEFYDYSGEEQNNRNNARRSQMDLNDKKEVERNTKNSPKVQPKRNMNQLNVQGSRTDNDIRESQRLTSGDNFESRPSRRRFGSPEAIIRNPVFEDRQYRRRDNFSYENDASEHGMSSREFRNNFNRSEYSPKRILKNPRSRDSRDHFDDYNDYRDDEYYNRDIDYIDNRMRNVRVRTSPKKHVTYQEEIYEHEIPSRYYENYELEEDMRPRREHLSNRSYNLRTTGPSNLKTGNNQQRQQQHDTSDIDCGNEDQYQYMETSSGTVKNTPNNNRNNTLNNSCPPHTSQSENPATTAAPTNAGGRIATAEVIDSEATDSASAATTTAADAKKHLRSSLCFNNGEIVADNDGMTNTPTSNQQRRNARSLAAGRRINVGLPD